MSTYLQITQTQFPMLIAGVLQVMGTGPKPVAVDAKDIVFGLGSENMRPLPHTAQMMLPDGFTRVLRPDKRLDFSTSTMRESLEEFKEAVRFGSIRGEKIMAEYPDSAEDKLQSLLHGMECPVEMSPTDSFFHWIRKAAVMAFYGTRLGRLNKVQEAGTAFYTTAKTWELASPDAFLRAFSAEIAAEIMLGFTEGAVGGTASLGLQGSGTAPLDLSNEVSVTACHTLASSALLYAYGGIINCERDAKLVNDASLLLSRAAWHAWASGKTNSLIEVYKAMLLRSREKKAETRSLDKQRKWIERTAANKLRLAWALTSVSDQTAINWGEVTALTSAASALISITRPDFVHFTDDITGAAAAFSQNARDYWMSKPFEIS